MKKWIWISIIVVIILGVFFYILGRNVSLSPDVYLNDPNGVINGCGWGEDCYYACSENNVCVMKENTYGTDSNNCDPNRDTCKDKIDPIGVISVIKRGICSLIPGLGIICA